MTQTAILSPNIEFQGQFRPLLEKSVIPPDQIRNSKEQEEQTEVVPELTPHEFKEYNRIAERMDNFHNHFRKSWMILTHLSSKKAPTASTARQFTAQGLSFATQLEIHHNIEETDIFPVLAQRMPAFHQELSLLDQHKIIHNGLEKFTGYLIQCRGGKREIVWSEVREIMESFGGVLWEHMDEEVRGLRAEEMRKYWTVQEMRSIPM